MTQGTGVFSPQPFSYLGQLKCAPDDGKYGLQHDEAAANVKDFCKEYDGQMNIQSQEKSDKYFQKVGGLLNKIGIKWAPDTSGCGKGELHDTSYTINRGKGSLQSKNIQPIPLLHLRLSVLLTAGRVYSLPRPITRRLQQGQTRFQETLVCTSDPRYTDALHVGTNAFDRDAAVKAIKDFCGKNLLFDPDVKDNTSSLSQYGDWSTGIAKGSGKAGTGIDVNASTLCKGQDPPKNQKFETGGLQFHAQCSELDSR